ncbi:MAG: response regulator transcription factor [Bacteroidia bacterium]
MSIASLTSLLKIVIVDDSLIVLERLKLMLSDMEFIEFAGYAHNISSAMQLINEQRPSVVILDIHLHDDSPDQNGLNLLEALRKKCPSIIVIMLTNLIEPQYRDKCISLGANYFFDKSNDFERIPETLKQISIN